MALAGRVVDGGSTRFIAATSAGVALVLVGAAAIVAWTTLPAEVVWPKVFDTLIALAATLVLAGCVGVGVDTAKRRAEERERERTGRLDLAHRVRAVHTDVKRSALLIDAHRSAQTYDEVMKDLTLSRARFSGCRFAIKNLRDIPEPESGTLTHDLERIAEYLEQLTDEYRTKFRTIADESAPDDWRRLSDGAVFPRLAILMESLTDEDVDIRHRRQFSNPVRAVVSSLLDQH